MKNKLLTALLLAGTSVALFSCNNGDYTATPAGGTTWNGSGGGGIMAAKVNGSQWGASTGFYTNSAGFTLLTGVSNDGKMMTIGIMNYNGPKTYNFDATTTATWSTVGSSTLTSSTTGSVTVTSDQNNNLKGTFQWSGNSFTATDGTFNLNKQ